MANHKDKKKLRKKEVEKLENTSVAGAAAGGSDGGVCVNVDEVIVRVDHIIDGGQG